MRPDRARALRRVDVGADLAVRQHVVGSIVAERRRFRGVADVGRFL